MEKGEGKEDKREEIEKGNELEENLEDKKNNYIVYLLVNEINNLTYVGITNNPDKRIRQHNGEIKGGAKYTSKSEKWNYYGFILNLDKSTALSIEKKIHIYSKKTYGKTPLERRLNCIENILKNYEGLTFIKL